MPFVNLESKDILRGTLIDMGWYLVKIISIGEAPSKDGGSTNYPIEGEIIQNAETGDTKYAGYPTPPNWNFNSKAIGFVVPFLTALGVEPKPGRVDLGPAQGMMIKVYIEHGEYNGRVVNQINHKYAPAT
jgi:hypothetical protein